MAENSGYNPIQFLKNHWGEIYTIIDVFQTFFKGLGGGGEVPDTVDPRLKGMVGLLGLKDERDFLMKIHALKRRLRQTKFRRTMLYFAWEISQAKELEDRLTYAGSQLVLMLYLNRLRTLFAGIPDKPGEAIGNWSMTSRTPFDGGSVTSNSSGNQGKEGKGPAAKDEARFEFKIMSDGSQPGVDVLEMLADEIDRNWRSLAQTHKNKRPEERLEMAFQMTRDHFRIAGLPRMPKPEEVANFGALIRSARFEISDVVAFAEHYALVYDNYVGRRIANEGWLMRFGRRLFYS